MSVILAIELQDIFLLFCRVGALFMVLPGISSMRVAVPIRLGLALAVSLALAPLVPNKSFNPEHKADAVALGIAAELLTGVFLGLLIRVYFLALEFMATGIAMSVGLSGIMGLAVEGQESQTAFANFVTFSALTLLFVLDFHHLAIRGLLESYSYLGPGEFPDRQSLMANFTETLVTSFRVTMQIASPFLAYAIIVNVMLGFLNKLALQIPVYFIALPFIIFGFLTLFYFVVPHILLLFGSGLELIFDVG